MTLNDDVTMARRYRAKRSALWRALYAHPTSSRWLPSIAQELGCVLGEDAVSSEQLDESGENVRRITRRVLFGDKPLRLRMDTWETYQRRVRGVWDEFLNERRSWAGEHIRLTFWTIKRVNGTHHFLEDLIQDGHEGLMRAIDRYDPDTGYRFFTYAVWWIRCSIFRGIESHRQIRLPEQWRKDLRIIATCSEELMKQGEHPTPERLAQHSGMSTSRVRNLLNSPRKRVPHAMVSHENPENLFEQAQLVKSLRDACKQLPRREKTIVSSRFGLEGEDTSTLLEIGDRLGLSRERIRQIQTQSLSRLQEALNYGHQRQSA